VSSRERGLAGETHVLVLAFQFPVLVLFERFHSGILLCAIDVARGTVDSVGTNVRNEYAISYQGFSQKNGRWSICQRMCPLAWSFLLVERSQSFPSFEKRKFHLPSVLSYCWNCCPQTFVLAVVAREGLLYEVFTVPGRFDVDIARYGRWRDKGRRRWIGTGVSQRMVICDSPVLRFREVIGKLPLLRPAGSCCRVRCPPRHRKLVRGPWPLSILKPKS
jgi:hypothetical protein